jgi:hypothetical protein
MDQIFLDAARDPLDVAGVDGCRQGHLRCSFG